MRVQFYKRFKVKMTQTTALTHFKKFNHAKNWFVPGLLEQLWVPPQM